MKKCIAFYLVSVFILLPLLFWAVGDFPQRTLLKEIISITILLAFFLMLGQFYLARSNRSMLKDYKMAGVLKTHKIIGYIFIGFLIIHPFLIIFPRYFEAGIEPMEAFTTLITTFNSTGIILGIIAWSLILILGISAIFRNKLGMKYRSWRLFHGILSICFIIIASWHAINLGRHIDLPMTILIIILAAGGIALLLNTYFINTALNIRTNGQQK